MPRLWTLSKYYIVDNEHVRTHGVALGWTTRHRNYQLRPWPVASRNLDQAGLVVQESEHERRLIRRKGYLNGSGTEQKAAWMC